MKKIPINKKNIFIACIGIFIFSTMLYWQTAFFDFVWDDSQAIVRNQKIRSTELAISTFYQKAKQLPPMHASSKNVKIDSNKLFPSEKKGSELILTSSNWRPLRTVIHSIIYRFWRLDPFWYHVANIVVHGIVVTLLFFLLLQLTGNMLATILGSLLFAAHPVNTEVVCWAKSLEDLLATLFLLVTFNLFLVLKQTSLNRWKIIIMLCTVIAYSLALFSKLSTVFFPLFIFLFIFYEKFKSKDIDITCIQGIVPKFIKTIKIIIKTESWILILSFIFMLEAITAIIARSLILDKVAQSWYLTGSYWTTWLSMPRVFLRYLKLQVFPYPLLSDYGEFPAAKNMADLSAWIYTVALIIVFMAVSWFLYKKRLLAPWFWFWCALIPFSNIIAMQQLGAERFLYIPTIAIAWLCAIWLTDAFNCSNKNNDSLINRHGIAVVFIIIIFIPMTIMRSNTWSSSLALFSTISEQRPDSGRARYNLASAYVKLNQPEKAFYHAKILISKYPNHSKALTMRGKTLCMAGQYKAGIAILQKQQNHIALNYAGVYAAKRGHLKAGVYCFKSALKFAPHNPRYQKNLIHAQQLLGAI